MKASLRFIGLLVVSLSALLAAPKQEESLALFENRKVTIAVPEGFSYKTATDDSGVVAVQLAAPQGKVTASLLFIPDPERQTATTRGRAEKMVEEFQEYVEGSVEKSMQFEELEPKSGAGTFCVFTDAKLVGQKDFPPNEYLHLTSGLKSWPGVAVVFRVFSNDTESSEYQAVMNMLRESVVERVVPLK